MKTREEILVHLRYYPRKLQEYIHSNAGRFSCISLPRRTGKTVCAIGQLLSKCFQNQKKNPHYAYIAPTVTQAHKVAWEYFEDMLFEIPNVKFNKKDYTITIRRSKEDKITIWLLSARDYNAIRGMYLDGCIIDEFGDCSPELYTSVIRPLLSDRRGWVMFIGTPYGPNHFYKKYVQYAEEMEKGNPDYFVCNLNSYQTGVIPLEELKMMRVEMTEEEWQREAMASFFAGVLGAYYTKALSLAKTSGRVTDVPHESGACVDTFWDLGVNDMCAIWFRQYVAGTWRYIDYYENSDHGLDHYVKVLQEKPYVYGKHVLPHDGEHRDIGTAKTRVQMLRDLGLRNVKAQKRTKAVVEDIEESRRRIKVAWFDSKKCRRGLDALAGYKREWDSKRSMFKKTPDHNEFSHGADAFRISAKDKRSGDDYLTTEDIKNLDQDLNYDPFSYSQSNNSYYKVG